MAEEGEEYLFARCFLTLEWNLMVRLESIVHAHFFHITWEDDCLVFCFAKSKSDQMGRNSDQVWHVYAMPNNPFVCPVLDLATYIFLPIPVSQMWRTSQRPMRMAIFLVVFSLGGISTGGSWIASGELLRRIRTCFLDLEFAPAIRACILCGRGRAVLPWQEALPAH